MSFQVLSLSRYHEPKTMHTCTVFSYICTRWVKKLLKYQFVLFDSKSYHWSFDIRIELSNEPMNQSNYKSLAIFNEKGHDLIMNEHLSNLIKTTLYHFIPTNFPGFGRHQLYLHEIHLSCLNYGNIDIKCIWYKSIEKIIIRPSSKTRLFKLVLHFYSLILPIYFFQMPLLISTHVWSNKNYEIILQDSFLSLYITVMWNWKAW